MHQRSALEAGEDSGVDLLGDGLVVGQHHAAARTAKRLVGRRRDDMRMAEGSRMLARCDEPREMSHVDQEQRADLVADLPESGEIEDGADRPSRRR